MKHPLLPRGPALCFICGRQSASLGYAPSANSIPGWFCEPCWPVVKKAYHMAPDLLNAFEERALNEAGNAAGQYLDAIGKTDLAALAPEEWRLFLETFLRGYGTSMRWQLEDQNPGTTPRQAAA